MTHTEERKARQLILAKQIRELRMEELKKDISELSTNYDLVHPSYEEAADILENLYKHRELKFTSVFEGYVPVQAYGLIDGMLFYFRKRGGVYSLKVGLYDLEVEKKKHAKMNESLAYPIPFIPDYPGQSTPTVVLKSSSTSTSRGGLVQTFQYLVEHLENTEKYSG
jgi:hypothetical protein